MASTAVSTDADPVMMIGANVPYVIDRSEDYALPVHGDDRGYPAILVEIRQDLIADHTGEQLWAERLARILGEIEAELKAALLV